MKRRPGRNESRMFLAAPSLWAHHSRQSAFRRVVERNISEQQIREAGAKAEIIENYPRDKYSPSGLLLGFTRAGRALHFQVSFAESDTTKIITVYEPDPNEWIKNRKRR